MWLFWVICTLVLQPGMSLAERSQDGLWTQTGRVENLARKAGPRKYHVLTVEGDRLRDLLRTASHETDLQKKEVIINVPMPDGTFERLSVEESPIFSPELQARYYDMRTYRAVGVDHPDIAGRLDFTPAGFHAMLFTDSGIVYVDPAERGDTSKYLAYWKHDVAGTPFHCAVDGATSSGPMLAFFPATNPSGTQLRTYRLAVSVPGEYTVFFGGVAGAAAQITTTVNRVTGIYEREVDIRLNLVATRIFADPTTDPFPSGSCDLRTQNQTELDANVGNANYDIGHIFGQGGSGGVASGGTVCVAGSKARGCTSLGNPSGDVFDVDFVAHEMGHQFGGNHTWSGNQGSCSDAGQFVASAAYEPGSASTIMGYAGICGSQNVQSNSDAYFHTRSYDEIVAFRTSGNGSTCGANSATGNTPPTVDAGANCTIPRSTPFTLTAQGEDGNSDPLTFNWEQFDAAAAQVSGLPSSTATSGPVFRSRTALTSPSRTFPRFQDILSGAATPWEVLPSVDRTLNFRATVRDNRAGGGGVDYDSMQVTVSGTPFQITAPASGAQLECGDIFTVLWLVGGGSVAPNVAIQFSTNGGTSFFDVLASTPNDGSQAVTVPQVLTSTGRVMLKPSAHCFFALSGNFSIRDTIAPSIIAPPNVIAECTSPTGTPVALGSPTVSDLCDTTPTVTNNAPALFPLGLTTVTWRATDDSGNQNTANQTVTIQDTTAPVISCNSPATTTPSDAPLSFTATATDVCDASPAVSITGFDCFTFNGSGKRIDKRESCVVQIAGTTISILDSGGIGDIIEWTVQATDGSGNVTVNTCTLNVVKKP